MATDFSRIRANPLLNYAGVQLKQGAVLLDADANELVAILDRRLRALAGDVLGRATVGANTPDAFKITLAGAANLNIGVGRLYVDGLLAENHGAAKNRVFDALLGEPSFDGPVTYDAQPYLPFAPPLPQSGRHLVYLDVWDREVTHLEQPDLVEPAVGVETGSRVQTIWQVRVLAAEVGSGVTCASPDADLPGWADLVAPSDGRLTTGTYEVAAAPDPCELPPTGGFRGLENQLYRVEIHDAGLPGGAATFKWSRDNASVGSRVGVCVSASELELDTLGRDDVLSIDVDDWVEILDDVREFAQAPGEIRKVKTADPATRRITFTAPLPADLLPAAFPDDSFPRTRNLRVRRWDQKRTVLAASSGGNTTNYQDLDASGSTGLIKVPAAGTTLLLENGVTVQFSAGARGFRSGDCWVFAARTSDASVEILDAAPPRGIHHHYARLAIWTAGSTTDPTDCRHLWPPAGGGDCACTECILPGPNASAELAAAITRIQDTGGTVCLHAGTYTLRDVIHVSGARSVRITGQGPATVLNAGSGAFSLESCLGVSIDNLSIITTGKIPAISVRSGAGISLHDLVLLVANPQAEASAIGLSGAIAGLTIRENLLVGPHGIRALDKTAPDPLNVLITMSMNIEKNVFWCPRHGIEFNGLVGHLLGSSIRDNEFLGCRDGSVSMLGFALPGASMRIHDNSFNVGGPGILCAVDGAWIQGNKLNAVVDGNTQPVGSGISLLTGLDVSGSDQCQLLSNQVSGFPDAAILIAAPVRDLICKLNILEKCGNGIVMTNAAQAGALSIENNHLRDIGSARAQPPLGSFIYGIMVNRALSATVAGNTLRRIGVDAVRGIAHIAGIVHFAVQRSRVHDNDLSEIGPATALPGAAIGGILLNAPYTQNEIQANHVERDALPAAADGADWTAIGAIEPTAARPIVHAGNFTAVFASAARMLVLNGPRVFTNEALLDFGGTAAAPLPRPSSIVMRANAVRARGAPPAVSLVAGADIQFGDNRIELVGFKDAVQLDASAAVVTSNVVRGGETSMRISATLDRVVVMGNATSAGITVNNGGLGNTPWAALNVKI